MNQLLPYVYFLSCPISMALMMWFMMRGMRGNQKNGQSDADRRIAQLEQEVESLRPRWPERDTVEMR